MIEYMYVHFLSMTAIDPFKFQEHSFIILFTVCILGNIALTVSYYNIINDMEIIYLFSYKYYS